MHILPLVALYLFVLLSPENCWADKVYRVVIFGDSISSGYQLSAQNTLAAGLQRKLLAMGYDHLEVIDLCKEKATTASAIEDVEHVLEKLPDVIVVQLGFNDTKLGVIDTAIHYNLGIILSALQKSNAYIILVGSSTTRGRDESYLTAVNESYRKLAEDYKITLYPAALEGIDNDTVLTLADGMHPNTAGMEVLVNNLLPLVDTGLRWRYSVYEEEKEQSKRDASAIIAPTLP